MRSRARYQEAIKERSDADGDHGIKYSGPSSGSKAPRWTHSANFPENQSIVEVSSEASEGCNPEQLNGAQADQRED